MYVNGESFGLTPEELRTILGRPDVEPSKPKRRRKLRKEAKSLLAAAGVVVGFGVWFGLAVLLPWLMGSAR